MKVFERRSILTHRLFYSTMFNWFKGEEKPKKDTSVFHYPDFYGNSIGPRFKVLESKEEYETRVYEKTKWVSTTTTETSDYSDAMSKGFWKLFNYIGGKNESKSKVAMTIPVRGQVTKQDNDKMSVITSFFVDQSKDCPAPTDETVSIKEQQEEKVFVRHFGGFAKDHIYQEELKNLKADLDKDGMNYVTDVYLTAGYDPPFKLWGRRNEVYLKAVDSQTSESS